MIVGIGAANAILNTAANTIFDGGQGRLTLFNGTVPTSADAAITNTAIAVFALPSDAFAVAANGKMVANAITAVASVGSTAGTAVSFAVLHRSDETVLTSAAASTDKRIVLTVGARNVVAVAMDAAQTYVEVLDITHFAASGTVKIDGETVSYTAKTTTPTARLTGLTRTAGATHAVNAVVYQGGFDMWLDSLGVSAPQQVSITSLEIGLV